ncbi:hypothetical protein Poli38472_007564 [Pythium oligandrum]|uniref:Uncharacterized protein n=1 Tax=Pythium oligandrum TaxID=41045 RepID=A0A8K1FQF3_PYTOL|nr:hypothetical protein Poli38472_007564 [Pythium oligandrum]|eukprot:TMW67892.1 hypothetical protein Poli38472_007564 [Pythium oligandrum]
MNYEVDAATLEAVAAFLDDYEATETALTNAGRTARVAEPSTSSSSDGDELSKPKRSVQKTVNSNRARDRKKREFLQLQREAELLDRQLTSLLEAKAKQASRAEQESARHSLTLHRERMGAWKEMALRQYRRRNASEAENMRLKELVAEQHDVLRGLQRVVQRQLNNNKVQPSDQVFRPVNSVWAKDDPRSMMQMLAELLTGLKFAYDTTDTWQATTGSMRAAGLQNNSKLVPLSSTTFAIECVDIRFFPFNLQAVAEAYWTMGVNYHCCGFDVSRQHTEVEGRETIFREQEILGDHVRLRRHASVQRFVENDRVLILHASRYSSIEVMEQQLSGITCSEFHWSLFQAPEADATDSALWTSTVRVTLDFHHGHDLSSDTIMILNEFFSAKLKRDVDAVTALVEDRLLQGRHVVQPGLGTSETEFLVREPIVQGVNK